MATELPAEGRSILPKPGRADGIMSTDEEGVWLRSSGPPRGDGPVRLTLPTLMAPPFFTELSALSKEEALLLAAYLHYAEEDIKRHLNDNSTKSNESDGPLATPTVALWPLINPTAKYLAEHDLVGVHRRPYRIINNDSRTEYNNDTDAKADKKEGDESNSSGSDEESASTDGGGAAPSSSGTTITTHDGRTLHIDFVVGADGKPRMVL